MKRRVFVVASVALIAVVALAFWGLRLEDHIVDCGFRGPVTIRFNQPDGQPLERGWFWKYRYRIDPSGALKIKNEAPPDGWVRIRISESCGSDRAPAALRAEGLRVGVRALEVRTEERDGGVKQVGDTSAQPNERWVSYRVVEEDPR